MQVDDEEKSAVDSRSVYVGNVDYSATPEELQKVRPRCLARLTVKHFAPIGAINRITILCDKYTGHRASKLPDVS